MKGTCFTLVLLLVAVLLFGACSEGSPGLAGDDDETWEAEVDDALDPVLQACLDFCDKSYECDQTGAFGTAQLNECKVVCENLQGTCVTKDMLECALETRCDAFGTCVLQYETNGGCVFPVDGDIDQEDQSSGPVIEVEQDVSFGAVVMGSSGERTLTITNSGAVALEIYNLTIVGNLNEFEMDFTNDEVLSILPKDDVDIQLTYTPLDAGKDEAKLVIYSNDPNRRLVEVALSSEYKGTANVQVVPESVNFNVVEVGQDSNALTLTISNIPGSFDDNRLLNIFDFGIEDGAQSGFSLVGDIPQTPFVIAPNENVPLQIQFSPQAFGDASDTLLIQSDSHEQEDQLINVPLAGFGAAVRLCYFPTSVQFGSVKVEESAQRFVDLEACGDSTVLLSDIGLRDEGGNFTLVEPPEIPDEGLALPLGETLRLELDYSPQAQLGVETNVLVIESDDMFVPRQEIPLSGQGSISNLTVSPTVLQFEDVGIDSSSSLNLVLRNTGSWPVEIESYQIGENSPFDVENGDSLFPMELNGLGGQQTIRVVFSPVTEGAVVDNLTFVSDNSNGDVTVGLTGRGTAVKLTLSEEESFDFGQVQLGERHDIILTVGNSGRAPLEIAEYGINLGESIFSVSPESWPDPLVWNSSIELTLSYEPSELGASTGSFYIDTNDADIARRHIEIDLAGEGIDPALQLNQQSPYDFGQVFTGAQVGPVAIELTNSGSGPLLIQSIQGDAGLQQAFVMVLPDMVTFPALLRPDSESDDHLTVLVSFAPNDVGDYQGGISIVSNDIDNTPLEFVVTGEGRNCPSGFYDCDDNPLDCEYACDGDPAASEVCNGEDDNCNCEIDEGFGVGGLCEGVGVCRSGLWECRPDNPGQVICSSSYGGSAYQGSEELCNNLDDDCDGSTDEDFGINQPCDGEGACGAGVRECRNYLAWRCSTDIGGTDYPAVPPTELCNGIDDDCDGQTDEGFGVGDFCAGVGMCDNGVIECATTNSVVCSTLPGGSEYPNQDEVCDGVDNDCDGQTDELWQIGQFCEGAGECGLGVWECETGSTRVCSTDIGGSLYPNPAPIELCDERDNDCDGETDEDYLIGEVCQGYGVCDDGIWECDSLVSARCSTNQGGSQYPIPWPQELCNGMDDDCDGETDEAFNLHQMCVGVGACGEYEGEIECAGLYTIVCSTDIGGSDYPDPPPVESCNSIDDDCDGQTDEGFLVGQTCDGIGECGLGEIECDEQGDVRCSSDIGGSDYSAAEEVCNGVDDDCDGITDESCKALIYRFERVISGSDHDHRLGIGTVPPDGFTLNPSTPVFSLYQQVRPNTAELVELINSATNDSIYTSNSAEILSLTSSGWSQSGSLGYIGTDQQMQGVLPLYRLQNSALSDHVYTASSDELALFMNEEGYDLEDVAGYVWESFIP